MKFATTLSTVILILATVFLSIPAVSRANDDEVTHEVNSLIEFMKISDCKFKRNGSWFESAEAADHIHKKYQYVQKKGLIKTAEDFIKYAATKSSISGQVYIVECENAEPQKSAVWLATALSNIRKTK